MRLLDKTMKSISKKMKIDYEELSKNIQHRTLKGDNREQVIRSFLERYIPKRFGIIKGEIVAVNGKTSKQQDVIIYDSTICPLLYNEEGIQVLPIEGVYTVIEVKSVLDEQELINSIKNISSVKKLPKKAFKEENSFMTHVISELGKEKNYFNTVGILFAYSSKLKLSTLKKKIESNYKKLKIIPNHQIDFIFILDRGLLVHYDKQSKQIIIQIDLNTDLRIVKTNDGLLLFYLMIMERLNSAFSLPIRIKDYATFLYVIE